ncbi:MAG: zf-TFIIB domain-containing protein [Thermoproteota archaeon]|nr:zf-TFIIB domain-containing protein [Thermoproteota archaeon]
MVNELTCPNCSTMMRTNQRYGVDIDFCPSCKGIWLDRGEIEKITNASKRYDEDPTYSNERPTYSNERPGNYDDHPREIRKYRNDDYDHDDDHRYESSQYGYKKKRRGFFNDFFDFD